MLYRRDSDKSTATRPKSGQIRRLGSHGMLEGALGEIEHATLPQFLSMSLHKTPPSLLSTGMPARLASSRQDGCDIHYGDGSIGDAFFILLHNLLLLPLYLRWRSVIVQCIDLPLRRAELLRSMTVCPFRLSRATARVSVQGRPVLIPMRCHQPWRRAQADPAHAASSPTRCRTRR